MKLEDAIPPAFEPGRLLITPGVLDVLARGEAVPTYVATCLSRHTRGDWGVGPAEDHEVNNAHVRAGHGVLMSAYPIDTSKPCAGFGDNTIWIFTDANRAATTIMLPEEY
jgi:hypothetical protein